MVGDVYIYIRNWQYIPLLYHLYIANYIGDYMLPIYHLLREPETTIDQIWPNATDMYGLFTYIEGEKWPHWTRENVGKYFLHGASGIQSNLTCKIWGIPNMYVKRPQSRTGATPILTLQFLLVLLLILYFEDWISGELLRSTGTTNAPSLAERGSLSIMTSSQAMYYYTTITREILQNYRLNLTQQRDPTEWPLRVFSW